MATCIRNKPNNQGTVIYKRHRFVRDKHQPNAIPLCSACGERQTNLYPKPKRKR